MLLRQYQRPQEKPIPPPAPLASTPAPQPVQPAIPAPAPAAPVSQPELEQAHAEEPAAPELESTSTSQGWEEPTTVQAPTWDDEPAKPQATQAAPVEEKPKGDEAAVPSHSEPVQQPVLSALPPQLQASAIKTDHVQAPAPVKPATPAAHTRPTSAAHKHKFKTDQAVIMPSGGFGSLEKVGMQFGSLSLGDDLDPAS